MLKGLSLHYVLTFNLHNIKKNAIQVRKIWKTHIKLKEEGENQ
jgi:hypothetical protein